MSKSNRVEEILQKSIDNIESDRAVTSKLLTDLVIYMAKTGDIAHQTVGHLATQYVETLQRSNEQLVKIASLLQKKDGAKQGLTELERQDLYNSIKES